MDICFLDIVVLGNCESFGCRTCRNEMEGVIRAVQDKVVIDELLHDITVEYNMTTIINTHDMNSVLGIGDNIIFICRGKKEWEGNKSEVMSSSNEDLNDLVFASELFKKVKEMQNGTSV